MANDTTKGSTPQPSVGAAADQNGAALAHMYRALRSFSLYPEGHPLRSDALQRAHQALAELVATRDLMLTVSRTGFVTTDAGAPVASAPMIQSLATELFIRRVKRLAILQDLTLFDLQKFLRLLTIAPDKIEEEGGMEALMAGRFIKSIWANEIDVSTIYEKREKLATGEETVTESFASPTEAGLIAPEEEQEDASLEDILARMAEETDDDRYRKHSETLLALAQQLRDQNQLDSLLTAFLFLSREENDAGRTSTIRSYAGDTLSQLLTEDAIEYLLDRLSVSKSPDHTGDDTSAQLSTLCADHWNQMGTQVMERYLNMESASARSALTGLYVRVGKQTLPLLLPLLNSSEWSIVLAILPLVGELGGEECVGELTDVVFHPNTRVRREAIRTLSRVGGPEAEQVLINLLGDRDPALKLQAILSLGIMQSRSAVVPLLGILNQKDLFLEHLQLKKEAAQALGRIGDRQATPHLLRILTKGRLIARQSWQELRIVVAGALGMMGDPAALESLRGLAHHTDKLGKACNEAADLLERRHKNTPT